MAISDPILGKCTEMCLGKCAEIAWSHLGYLFHCSKNIQKLKNEKENLENEWTRINIMVESEKRNAKIILPDVENWKKSVEKMKEEIDEFLRDEQRKNMRCFKCGCPNIRWRYRLGKKSKSMTESVTSLKDEGIRLTGLPVAHSPPPPEIPSAHEHWKSRDHIFKEIMDALKDPHFKLIGVHGAGGVGKTTMVNEAGNKAKGEMLFDVVAMATVSQKMDKKKVQEDLASYLGLKLEGNEIERTNLLKRRLNNEKKNLIILDDVWEPLNLADIGIPVIDGCKVVVTSRKKDVFGNIMRKSVNHVDPTRVKEFQIDDLTEEEARRQCMETAVKEFWIDVLTDEEAWKLFMKTAEISDNFEMRPEADELCRECGGLPVAILAVAGALRGKERYSWKDAVEQLKNSKLDDIVDLDQTRFSDLTLFSTLRLSYDYLSPKDAQSCFLLCSMFPEDAKISIDDLVRYSFGMRLLDGNFNTLEKVRNRVLTLVKRLQEDYLLLDGGDENVVSMHDVIRDVAILIAKKERGYLVEHNLEKWPERINYESYLAISFRFENFHDLPNELECKQLHTIVLKCNESRYTYTPAPKNFFKGLENSLEVLDLSEMAMESPPPSIAMLVELRMLSLNVFTRDIALLGRLKSLEILILHGIEELAPEISHLTRLRLLDLSTCHKLDVIPPNVISKLPNLEELYISLMFDQWDVKATNQERRNASLVELNSLTHLTVLQVYIPETSLTLLSDSCFSKLIRFDIYIGTRFSVYFNLRSQMILGLSNIITVDDKVRDYFTFRSQRILKLSNIITLEDKFKVLMNKAEGVLLNELEDLRKVLSDRDGMIFSELKYLKIHKCNNVEHIFGRPEMLRPTPRQQVSFGKLCSLTIFRCTAKYLFPLSVARCLVKLQKLILEDCAAMEEIVINEGQGDDGALIFPKLEYMQLMDLPNLRSFCSSTKETSIKDADNSNPAQPLFSETVVFPSLSDLTLIEIPNMKAVWNSTPLTNSLNNLISLGLSMCGGLSYVAPSEVLGNLSKLQELAVLFCDSIEEVFRSTGSNGEEGIVPTNVMLPHLSLVVLQSSPRLKSICSGIKLPSSIRWKIGNCPSFLRTEDMLDVTYQTYEYKAIKEMKPLEDDLTNEDEDIEETPLEGNSILENNLRL